MTRPQLIAGLSTSVSRFIRQYAKASEGGLCVTNLDFVIEDFKQRKLMLLEEKTRNGTLGFGQRKTFQLLDGFLKSSASSVGYDYWGFYLLTLPAGCDMPGPGMLLNGEPVTVEQFTQHISFQRRFCDGWFDRERAA